ncbi:MAG: hypothetical protein MJ151_02610, partial [Lachnospiraceae bacterium]|nr:hypothetical protein [Lachnospiraceae bacterium]
MDDLYNWSYFPETNIFTFAFKFYDKSSRYRPFYDAVQYIEYLIVAHKPILFTYINIAFNSVIALFIYHFSKKLKASWIVAFIVSLMYILSHFSYYQIGQATGLVESLSLLISLLILYKAISYIQEKNEKTFLDMVVLYFIMAFTHERFLFMYGIIVFSIIFSEMINKIKLTSKQRLDGITNMQSKTINALLKIFVVSCEVVIILFIRKMALGKVLPAGTAGTYVEDTFDIKQMIGFCINQVQYIFGMNKGPQHLCGIDFSNLSKEVRYFTVLHMVVFLMFILVYMIIKVVYVIDKKNTTKENRDKNAFVYFIQNFYIDILILEYIAFSIIFSSVTIRLEMRFVYTSFTAMIIYLSYMVGYICGIPYENVSIIGIVKTICIFCFVMIMGLRVPAEIAYRDNYKYIYFFGDQARYNSLAENTVYRYGEDIIDKKKVYIVGNSYNVSKFYGDYF